MRVIVLLALCFAAVTAVSKNPQRIIGGSVTTIELYPEMASLLFSNTGFRQACGGTILNERAVLTAAQCTSGYAASRWRVRVGSTNANSGGHVHNTQSIINHPSFSWTLNNDIAIIRVSSPFSFNNKVRAAYIAGSNYDLGTNQPVWATGWGRSSPNGSPSEQLRHVQIWIVSQSICAQRYAAAGMTVTVNMLCAGWLDFAGRDQCYGDEGGPLYHNGIVVAVYSWGYSPCNNPRFPGVHARVSRYTSWIQANA